MSYSSMNSISGEESEYDDDDQVIIEENTDVGKEQEKEKLENPKKGMEFDGVNEIYLYYKEHGKQMGFGVKKKSTAKTNGVVTYVTLACHKSGKSQLNAINISKPNTITKTDCKTRVCAKLSENNKWRLSTVELNHNHDCSPTKSRRFRCNRVVKLHTQRQLFLRDRNGLRINKNIDIIVAESGGHENVTFVKKDAQNIIAKERQRRLKLDGGDAMALQNYFRNVQKIDKEFFYSIDLDEENRIKNLFWGDARSRTAYEEFNDVITFDTTYLTNKYDMPFAPFVGINHHGHSVLFGCGLISHEDTKTFVWLFDTWLTCMSGHAPSAIITDQAIAMKNAIEIVFPRARHRWCLWHIMKKIPKKFSGYEQYKSIKKCLKNAVYDSLESIEFEEKWKSMVLQFGLEKNSWLEGLYAEKEHWVSCYVKDHFWAGMSTTQRSESMNAFFDGYVNAKTSFKQFVEQYDNALMSKVEKEKDADFNSFNSRVQTITQYPMEKQFQSVYTISKFREFQEQLKGFMYCVSTLVNTDGGNSVYDVSEIIIYGKDNESSRLVSFKVFLVWKEINGDFEVHCNCRLFEFRGILCKHIITVLIKNFIFANIPDRYILRRWRKDIRRRHIKTRVTYNDWGETEDGRRYDRMIKAFYDIVDISYEFEEKCMIVLDRLSDLKSEILRVDGVRKVSEPSGSCEVGASNEDKVDGKKAIRSPIPVRCKGRPPCKRKQSKVEQIITKRRSKNKAAKESKNKLKDKMDETSTKELGDLIDTQQSIINQSVDQNMSRLFAGTSCMDLLQFVCVESLGNEGCTRLGVQDWTFQIKVVD